MDLVALLGALQKLLNKDSPQCSGPNVKKVGLSRAFHLCNCVGITFTYPRRNGVVPEAACKPAYIIPVSYPRPAEVFLDNRLESYLRLQPKRPPFHVSP